MQPHTISGYKTNQNNRKQIETGFTIIDFNVGNAYATSSCFHGTIRKVQPLLLANAHTIVWLKLWTDSCRYISQILIAKILIWKIVSQKKTNFQSTRPNSPMFIALNFQETKKQPNLKHAKFAWKISRHILSLTFPFTTHLPLMILGCRPPALLPPSAACLRCLGHLWCNIDGGMPWERWGENILRLDTSWVPRDIKCIIVYYNDCIIMYYNVS